MGGDSGGPPHRHDGCAAGVSGHDQPGLAARKQGHFNEDPAILQH